MESWWRASERALDFVWYRRDPISNAARMSGARLGERKEGRFFLATSGVSAQTKEVCQSSGNKKCSRLQSPYSITAMKGGRNFRTNYQLKEGYTWKNVNPEPTNWPQIVTWLFCCGVVGPLVHDQGIGHHPFIPAEQMGVSLNPRRAPLWDKIRLAVGSSWWSGMLRTWSSRPAFNVLFFFTSDPPWIWMNFDIPLDLWRKLSYQENRKAPANIKMR